MGRQFEGKMKTLSLFICSVLAVKLKDADRSTVLEEQNVELNKLQIRNDRLFVHGIDSLYEVNIKRNLDLFKITPTVSDVKTIYLPSDRPSCRRLGGICQDEVTEVFVAGDGARFACGTDSSILNCVNIKTPEDSFHAQALAQPGRVIQTFSNQTDPDQMMIITAWKGVTQISRFAIPSRNFVTVGEATQPRKVPRQILASTISGSSHYHIGREWDQAKKKWTSFMGALCLNDPGLSNNEHSLLSPTQRYVSCCLGSTCFDNVVSATQRGESIVAVFNDHTNTTTAVCEFGQRQLVDIFFKKAQHTIPVRTINLAQCRVYQKLTPYDHDILSDYRIRHPDTTITDVYAQQAVVWHKPGVASFIALNEKTVALLYEKPKPRIAKYSVVDNEWIWNNDLSLELAKPVKSVTIFNNELFVLHGQNKLDRINLVTCHSMSDKDQIETPVENEKQAFCLITFVAGMVCLLVGIVAILIYRKVRARSDSSSEGHHPSGSEQAPTLDSELSDSQSFILQAHQTISHELLDKQLDFTFESRHLEKTNRTDQESFKSDYMSCSSKDLSSSNSEVDASIRPKTDEAIIVFPNGTIGRLKANKLKKIKNDIDDLKLCEDEERALAETLKRTLRKKT